MPGKGRRRRKTRARYGTGSMKEPRPGYFELTVSLGTDTDGKRIRRTITGRSPEEVEEKAAELKAQHRHGMDLSADKITLAQHIDVWLRSKKRSVSSGTHRNYTDRLEYVKERLGTVTLRDLTENHINEMNEWLADEKEFSPRFIYDINATLRSCIQAAVQPRGPLMFNLDFSA